MQEAVALVKVDDLTLKSGSKTLVEGLSLELFPGEILALVGETGSGKSLTAAAVCSLLPSGIRQVSGRVRYANKPTGGAERPGRLASSIPGHFIGMVFQDPGQSLNPVFRVGDQIKETLLQLKRPAEKADILSLLKQVELPDGEAIMRAYPHQLSGGQQQRIMIALALAGDPEVLIADEPLSALDLAIQKDLVDLLLRLIRSRGMSLLLIAHDLPLCLRISDRVAVLHQGRLVFCGKTMEVSKTKHPIVKKLLANPEWSFPPSTPAQPEPLLRIRELSVFHHQRGSYWRSGETVKALDSISLEIFKQESLGILGASGSGKTTLARVISGLQAPSQGVLDWLANPSRVQMIFQMPGASLNPRMRISSMLRQVAKANMQTPDPDHWLAKVGLENHIGQRFPHQLSGGQQQRVALARALAAAPDLLICDEPVSALDPAVRQAVLDVLKTIHEEEKLTLLIISHHPGVLVSTCQRLLVLDQGQIAESVTSPDLLGKLQSPAAQKILAAAKHLS